MITEDKVTEIFCMADDFCKFFDVMVAKYTLKPTGKRKYHRDSTMSKAEVMLIIREFGIRKGLKKLVISSKIRIFIGENQ